MHGLQKIFPPTEFALLVVILALPLIGAIVNGIFGKRLGKEAVTTMALFAVGGAFVASLVSFVMLHLEGLGVGPRLGSARPGPDPRGHRLLL